MDSAIKQFIHDMIHMTEGEKLIYYWPLWLCVIFGATIFILFAHWRKR